MLVLCYVLGGVALLVLTLYLTLEFHYFMRMAISVLIARFFKSKVAILDETYTYGVCLTTDVDTLLFHMNNARYLRELDFARVDFYERTGLYRKIRQKGGAVVQGACTIRYRRFVRPFSRFKITSKVIYWDTKSVFMEHRFITPKDDFVRAIVICQQRVINCNAEDIISELLGAKDEEVGSRKPPLPLEVAKWIESNEISSANLRNGC
ncbi:protein THEM6-like [Schistocerca americana]|uniref:protein THEM6-like n=1 Tax=Schistocerca americana TaxID=7009 RepID=UPI001F4F1A0C|nr:protein THEM6-like [Schistocerca americana]XP_047112832.1 protein THEM6-like [Schistocerca piceifrons]XP_049808234.1 protein THEM6-like [Schistocerca nitens]XP_049956206.1 protein THEM6-like [Schistocerca serialis cubense]